MTKLQNYKSKSYKITTGALLPWDLLCSPGTWTWEGKDIYKHTNININLYGRNRPRADFLKTTWIFTNSACHWPSYHMISSRPVNAQPPLPLHPTPPLPYHRPNPLLFHPARPPNSSTQLIHPTCHPTCPPDLFTRLVHPTHPPNSFTLLVQRTCRALKLRSCSRLHSGIVHALQVFDSWLVHAWTLKTRSCSRLDLWMLLAWSLKIEELFQIGLVNCPCMAGVRLMWIVLVWSL